MSKSTTTTQTAITLPVPPPPSLPTPISTQNRSRNPIRYIRCEQAPYQPPSVCIIRAGSVQHYQPSQASIQRLQHLLRYRIFSSQWTMQPHHSPYVGWTAQAVRV